MAKVDPNGELTSTPPICLWCSPSNKTNDSDKVTVSNSRRSVMVKPSTLGLSLNKSSTQRSIISFKGIFVKSDSTSNLGIIKLES